MTTPIKKLYRSDTERWIAGVAGGMADYFEMDPTIMRVLFLLLVFITGGAAIILYILAAIIVPREPKEEGGGVSGRERFKDMGREFGSQMHTVASNFEAGMKEFGREMRETHVRSGGWSRRNIIATVIIVIGLIAFLNAFFPSPFLRGSVIWPVALILLGLFIVFKSRD